MQTDNRGIEYVPSIAHIRLVSGEVFQVLNEDGTDWDEQATQAEIQQYINSKQK